MLDQLMSYTYSWPDFVGNVGVAILIATFFLNIHGKISATGFWYSFNNLLVSILLGISLLYNPNLSGIIIEAFWFVISFSGLIRVGLRKRRGLKY
jgi:hypothetical protein